jgi:Ring finger domain
MSPSSPDRRGNHRGDDELVCIGSPKIPTIEHTFSLAASPFETANGFTLAEQELTFSKEREEEESIELARRLMAEEAMASYEHHFQLLQESANLLSQEDYDALQRALEENDDDESGLSENQDLSYDAMLELGDRIGDVKTERWTMIATTEICKLPTFKFSRFDGANPENSSNDIERKCLVCQFEYEADEEIRRMPCGHCFHMSCVDVWLQQRDFCPYCRQCIVER